jgi:hypothetical protein
MFMGIDADPKDLVRASGPLTRKHCPFCACEHLWYKEDSKVLNPKPVARPRALQAS